MRKKYLPEKSRRNHLPSSNVMPRTPPDIFTHKEYLNRGATGNRFQASQIIRTATYKDAHGNQITLKEHETVFTGPKDMRGGTFITPTKRIGRR